VEVTLKLSQRKSEPDWRFLGSARDDPFYEGPERHHFNRCDSALRMQAMSERIKRLFGRCRERNRVAFIPYICAGDPTLSRTVEIALALEKAGADLLELGVPFSDPLADGIVNQLAAQRALEAGATVRGVLDCVREIRRHSEIPIVLYTYLNPVLRYGIGAFDCDATDAGVDGVLILDLPPDEDRSIRELDGFKPSSSSINQNENSGQESLVRIRLIAPTTTPERIAAIVATARGFIYYVSREGVTGARESVAQSLAEKLTRIRQHTRLPIAVGFGISNPGQAATVAKVADAVVIGSAIVDLIGKAGDSSAKKVHLFAQQLAVAIHHARQGAAAS
jgi:tryptophan synthase alpha chain